MTSDLAEQALEEALLRLRFVALAAILVRDVAHGCFDVLAAASPGGLLAGLALNLTAHGVP